jgi:hypothetical protein
MVLLVHSVNSRMSSCAGAQKDRYVLARKGSRIIKNNLNRLVKLYSELTYCNTATMTGSIFRRGSLVSLASN